MILSASFNSFYAELEPLLARAADYVDGRLTAELRELHPVTVQVRVKSAQSLIEKLQRGEVADVFELDDLVAARAVFLHSAQVAEAIEATKTVFTEVVEEKNVEPGKPTDFRYQQPHLIAKLPPGYVARHKEFEALKVEVQFTTYVQHALQESSHDVIYKGERFSWREHRLDGQLRGLLEIVDDVLANISSIAEVAGEPSYAPFDRRNSIIEAAKVIFPTGSAPTDMRRFVVTIEDMLTAAQVEPIDLPSLMELHPDLINSYSLTAVDKVLGVLLRERWEQLLAKTKKRRWLVSTELETLVEEAKKIPADKRVKLRRDLTS